MYNMKKIPKPMKSTRSNKETTLCENDIKTTYFDKIIESIENIIN